MEKQTWLPIELILNVVTCSLPAPGTLLDAAHPTTKLLLTFTLVCRETRRVARRGLREHCAYLDSERRLSSFLRAIPSQPDLRGIVSLTLAPFDHSIDNLPLCSWVRELFCFTCESLTKLVIDMPLRTCYPENDHLAVRPVLRVGFERLVNLVEFVSTRDELYLDVTEFEDACVWEKWPRLERLALYNVSANEKFWQRVARHPSLETLILSNPDSFFEVDPKVEYFKHTSRSISIMICQPLGYRVGVPDYGEGSNWTSLDPNHRMAIFRRDLLGFDDGESYLDLDGFRQCIRVAVEDGSLWLWQGEKVTHPDALHSKVGQ
ncbi:hypothetical protein FB567DRAFT_621059 [Paraphoma chrysanthemicola]|uniref:Uncharacterized protein n=1 Tax=Paraphoma chrysanthemicola TaxID=798071 RepID=A0A8K0R5M5_9PLEO|nr:hypothetical protein FB567DRAFT_621059 [Paraphoma chrysanthemicola]